KNPDHRYQTAEAFADDLQRWLRLEPTAARPAQPLRRVSLWARRNKGWATVILTSSLAILISALLTIALFASEASHAKKEAARSKRESLLEQLQHLQLMPHHQDWSRQ